MTSHLDNPFAVLFRCRHPKPVRYGPMGGRPMAVCYASPAMPMAMPSPCAAPFCPELTVSRFCTNHSERTSGYDAHRPSAAKRGYGRRWGRLRRMVLSSQPKCSGWPKGTKCWSAANEVDHIVPKVDGGSDQLSNLQGLCKPCHSRKTLEENPRCD